MLCGDIGGVVQSALVKEMVDVKLFALFVGPRQSIHRYNISKITLRMDWTWSSYGWWLAFYTCGTSEIANGLEHLGWTLKLTTKLNQLLTSRMSEISMYLQQPGLQIFGKSLELWTMFHGCQVNGFSWIVNRRTFVCSVFLGWTLSLWLIASPFRLRQLRRFECPTMWDIGRRCRVNRTGWDLGAGEDCHAYSGWDTLFAKILQW